MFSARPLGSLLAMAAVVAALAVAIATPALAADGVDARFEIFGFAGLHVLTNLTRTRETPYGYSITTDLDTRGLASAFVDLRSHSEVQGTFAGEMLRPEAYHAEVRRNGADRQYGLKYQGDGSVVDTVPPSASPVHPDRAQLRGTVDQLTAYFLVERQLATRHLCRLVVPVYDGSEFYKLNFTDIGDETLSADHYQRFAGPTHVCDVVREVIAANPDKKEGTYQHGKLWYAPLLPGHRMVPVRMEYDTLFGQVQGYLAEANADGSHLRFMGE